MGRVHSRVRSAGLDQIRPTASGHDRPDAVAFLPECHGTRFALLKDHRARRTMRGPTEKSMLGKVFKAYDVRATVPKPLTEKLAWQIGYGAAVHLLDEAHRAGRDDPMMRHVVVGRDVRATSPMLRDALCTGIRDSGSHVIDIGICDTPMVSFAVNHLDCGGGIQVTASHNPANYNGFKFCGIGARPIGEGSGLEHVRRGAATADRNRVQPAGGRLLERDLWDAYRAFILERLGDVLDGRARRPVRLAIDASNGSAGAMIPRIFDGVPGLRIDRMNFEHGDGVFVHDPNPLVESNLDALREFVVEKKSDAGICFDGDADRLVLLDETGATVGGDLLTALLAESFLRERPGAAIVHDLRSSRALPERVRKLGGEPVSCRVGHVFMKAAMARHDAILGGELSGHFYFADTFRADSGARALCAVLGFLAADDVPLSKRVAPLRKYAQSGEINFECEDVAETLDEVRDHYSDAKLDELDGLSIDAGPWWANIRASNTEPLLRLNLEARKHADLDAAIAELAPQLGRRVDH